MGGAARGRHAGAMTTSTLPAPATRWLVPLLRRPHECGCERRGRLRREWRLRLVLVLLLLLLPLLLLLLLLQQLLHLLLQLLQLLPLLLELLLLLLLLLLLRQSAFLLLPCRLQRRMFSPKLDIVL